MAYIAPNSTIEFFADFGLDSNYENTLYFQDTATKDTYFSGILKEATVTAQSYTRAGRGIIKVQLPMSTMYKCGYMRFKNTSFENKWFYAFITGVDYINNITTEVRFQLDIVMTWMGAFTLGQCFIERQHTTTDNIGDNIVDEGLPCGDMIYEFSHPSGYMGSVTANWKICLVSTADPTDGSDQHGAMYGGIYSGAGQWYYDADTDIATLNAHLSYLNSTKPTAIIGLAIVPAFFLSQAGSYSTEQPYYVTKPYTSIGGTGINNTGGYVPDNNKLFTYPYKSLQVTNMEGNFAEFRYEFFNTDNSPTHCDFELYGVTGLNSEVCCTPLNYKNIEHNITEKISMNDFPMCSYSVDAYDAYIAQNKSSMAANVMSSIITAAGHGVAAAATGGVSELAPLAGTIGTGAPQMPTLGGGAINSTTGIASTIINTIGKVRDLDRMPPQRGGSQGVSATIGRAYGKQNKDFYFIGKSITPQYAYIIDSFFTMFGYAIKSVGTPNMKARPHFTYVKTVGCIVKGEMPSDDCKAIEAIFDKGVRFWTNHNEIGNFTVNNQPT